MIQLQNIKTALAYESSTNPRGKDFEGPAFDELTASVKEKGVLVPVLARPRPNGKKQFEIVAGNRRFRAAVAAGFSEIPAMVREMSDVEAREAQIIENLQREDIHPLEEGEAYRKLIEQGKNYDLEAVAAKVGKPLSYVRQRLVLTDLCKVAADAYRTGVINGGHAVQIARLGPEDQPKAVKFVDDREADSSDLRQWIQELTIKKLSAAPPWKTNEERVAALAPCVECNKKKGGNLFGEGAAEHCGDPTCFARRLAAHIAIVKAEYAEKKTPLTLVSSEWRKPSKGVLSQSEYRTLEGKDTCKSEHKALVVEGDEDIGQVLRICTDANCSVHGRNAHNSVYTQTPEERAKRKKEIAKQRAKEEREYNAFVEKIRKGVSWPLSEKALAVLLEKALDSHGFTSLLPVARRLELKQVKEKTGWGGEHNSFKPPLREWLKKASREDRLRMYFELVLDCD